MKLGGIVFNFRHWSPVNDQIIFICSPSFNIIWIFERYIFWGKACFGMSRGQRLANFVACNHSESVIRPRGHANFEGRVRGRYNIWKSTLLLMDVYCTVWVHVACKVVGMINSIVEKEKRNQWSFRWIYYDFWNKLSHTHTV